MGWIQDLLSEVPLSAVLRERVALAHRRYEEARQQLESCQRRVAELERENEALRVQIPVDSGLAGDTAKVLVELFKSDDRESRDVGTLARRLGTERSVLKYHLDRLDEAKLAEVIGGNYMHGRVYWGLTPEGRRCVVERKLI